MQKYVFFDVDGTLNQTKLYALPAYKKALRKRNLYLSEEAIVSCFGMKPEDIVKKMLGNVTEEEIRVWRKEIEETEAELMRTDARPFPGIKEVIEQLRGKGYHTAICSNAYENHIQTVLKAIGLEGCFDMIGSLEFGNSKSEVLHQLLKRTEWDRACLVGDRRFDLQAAKDNNIPIIGCLYGYAPDEMKESDRTVNHPVEILQKVEELLG